MAPKTSRDQHQIGATVNSGWLVFGEMLTESLATPARQSPRNAARGRRGGWFNKMSGAWCRSMAGLGLVARLGQVPQSGPATTPDL